MIFTKYFKHRPVALLAVVLLAGCHSPQAVRSNHPAQWWTPVPTNGAPGWEIFPQDAAPGEVILSKRNELGLLSNFAATPFEYHGKHYASVEGFWQMLKYPESPEDPRAEFPGITWPHTREEVGQMTGFDAKHAGDAASENMRRMNIDWVTFEGHKLEYHASGESDFYKLIVAVMRAKVEQNPEVKRVLLATGDLVLKPDHRQEANAAMAWKYYDIWIQIRAEMRK